MRASHNAHEIFIGGRYTLHTRACALGDDDDDDDAIISILSRDSIGPRAYTRGLYDAFMHAQVVGLIRRRDRHRFRRGFFTVVFALSRRGNKMEIGSGAIFLRGKGIFF